MNKLLLAFVGLFLISGVAYSEPVRDWRDLEKVQQHIREAIHEMERAAKANHYDMNGHGAKAEQFLRDADRELHEAIESAKHAR